MKNKKIKIVLLLCIFFLLTILLYNSSFGRYIYNSLNNSILESQNFYFKSTVLTLNGANYGISNWDGVNAYTITVDVNSKKNELTSTKTDISYDIKVECPSSVICTTSKSKGIIYSTNKTDSYVITIVPIENFNKGDEVIIKTSVTSTYPYTKTLSGTYHIGVENYGFSYHVSDQIGSKFVTLELTNSKPYYEVITAFDQYKVGDHISLDVYHGLSNSNKAKCLSVQLKVDFDPRKILLDLTNSAYLNSISTSETTVDGYRYIQAFTLNMDANSNQKIIFYKRDINKDYSSDSSIVKVTLER